jgi:hypothetical protein
LNYGVQNQGFTTGAYNNARISWRVKDGALVRIDNVTSPQLAYRTLFTSFVAADPTEAAHATALLDRHKSVIDLVRRSTERLLPELGRADRDRLTRHFDEIRALENRLNAVAPQTGGACAQYPNPGDDAAADGDEDRRSELFVDLIGMGLACDLSRVATLQIVWENSTMNTKGVIGVDDEMHNISHHFNFHKNDPNDVNAPSTATIDIIAWQVKQFARLIKKLKDTEDFDGKTVLDNTAVVMGFEGGYGHDADSGLDQSPHSTENMCILVGGRAGGLRPGQHIIATDKHPASPIISAMNAVGCAGGLGEISESVPELFT